jgi:hypothetical protein
MTFKIDYFQTQAKISKGKQNVKNQIMNKFLFLFLLTTYRNAFYFLSSLSFLLILSETCQRKNEKGCKKYIHFFFVTSS